MTSQSKLKDIINQHYVMSFVLSEIYNVFALLCLKTTLLHAEVSTFTVILIINIYKMKVKSRESLQNLNSDLPGSIEFRSTVIYP